MVSSNLNTGLKTSVLVDDSFAEFVRGVDRSLLFDNDFIDALYSLDPDLLTDERFTTFLSSQGAEILLDDSFVQFTAIIDRDLLSDNSFSAFLNGIGKSALTDSEFTGTLLALDNQVIKSGNFTGALLAVDEDMLKSQGLQQALRELEPEMLTDDNFAGLLTDGGLSGTIISADIIRGELNSLNSGLEETTEDELLNGGQQANLQDLDIGISSTFNEDSTAASIDLAVADFISAGNPLAPSDSSIDSLELSETVGSSAGESIYLEEDALVIEDISDSPVPTQKGMNWAIA